MDETDEFKRKCKDYQDYIDILTRERDRKSTIYHNPFAFLSNKCVAGVAWVKC
jgi:hypothetical protein